MEVHQWGHCVREIRRADRCRAAGSYGRLRAAGLRRAGERRIQRALGEARALRQCGIALCRAKAALGHRQGIQPVPARASSSPRRTARRVELLERLGRPGRPGPGAGGEGQRPRRQDRRRRPAGRAGDGTRQEGAHRALHAGRNQRRADYRPRRRAGGTDRGRV